MQKFTNKKNVPLSMAVWLAADDYAYNSDPNVISATTLLQPIRAIVLARQNKTLDKIADISDMIAARMGTAIHDSVEKAWLSPKLETILEKLNYTNDMIKRICVNPNPSNIASSVIPVYIEQRTTKAINGMSVTGQFDLVIDGVIEDIKSTSVYTYIFGSNNEKYKQQMSIYRWLFPNIIIEDYGYVNYVFTDWAKMKARQDRGYPQDKQLQYKVKLMSIQETEDFIKSIVAKIKLNLPLPQDQLPECTRDELWQRDDIFKYYKNPANTARSTKNYNTLAEAQQRHLDDGEVGMVKVYKGEVVRCKYCNVVDICSQAANLKAQGLINDK